MKAVIMCGGAGSRLRPLTESRPKPLCRVLNVPVLETIIGSLIGKGITEIYLSLGCKARDIIDFCESRGFDAELHYCEEERPLGTAGGVKNCIGKTDDTILVVSGDNLTDLDYTKAEAFHNAAGSLFTVVGKDVPDPREYGVIIKDEEENILAFSEKPTWEQTLSFTINTGIYIFNGSVLDKIPENEFYDFSEDLFPVLLREKVRFLCYKTEAFWGDMGEFEAFHEITADLLSRYRGVFPSEGIFIENDYTDESGNTFIAPCLIGERFEAGKNNRIGPFAVIGNDAVMGSGCTVKETIAGDGLFIDDGSDLFGIIADDNVTVRANCVLEKGTVVGYGCEIGKFSRLFSGVKIWPGKKIVSESVISRDMYYETPDILEIDSFGISGKVFSQISVSDAARLGQAVASVKNTVRVGVGNDSECSSEIYKNLCSAGIRSCGVICYDFEEMYKSQAYFYSAYCSLDAFIFISTSGDTVNFSFFGKNGLPVSAKTARNVNNNFRFSAFKHAESSDLSEAFRMNLLSTAYSAALQRTLSCNITGKTINIECENRLLKNSFSDFLKKSGAIEGAGGLQFLINESGTEMYCMENEKFYSSDRIKTLLCELEFADGRDVVAGEDIPASVSVIAEKYGRRLVTVYENHLENKADISQQMDNIWNFDAVFLCVKLMNVVFSAQISLSELMKGREDIAVRKKIVELDIPSSELKERIEAAGAKKTNISDVYFDFKNKKGIARVRQLGNSNRLRVLCEAADMETASEITADLCSKILKSNIDKDKK